MKQLDHKRGFMLIELMFVLVIVSFLFFLTPLINKSSKETRINQFLEVLHLDINYGLEYSMTHFTIVRIKIYPNENYYRIIDGNLLILKTTKFDTLIKIDSYITNDTIEITHGNVVKASYFYLSCGNLKYKINIYEKSGIINVSK